MNKILKFLSDLILFIIAYITMPFIEFMTMIVVFVKYEEKGFNYFDNLGYSFDVQSASRNRTLWNTILLKEEAKYKFVKDTKYTISQYIGLNYLNKDLSFIGYTLYYLLYLIDFTNWIEWKVLFKENKLIFKKGHCLESLK